MGRLLLIAGALALGWYVLTESSGPGGIRMSSGGGKSGGGGAGFGAMAAAPGKVVAGITGN